MHEQTMNFTGERFTPGGISGEIELEHWHRYSVCADFVRGKTVLDIASGEGYGSYFLASVAGSVTGVDISGPAVEFAARKYTRPNLVFKQGDCTAIPMGDGSVDVVVSFETIEHHDKHFEMLSEIRRVLKPGGTLIMSSPDKKNYSDAPNHHNEFHVKELYRDEFFKLIQSRFASCSFFSQKIVKGSVIAPVEDARRYHLEYLHYGAPVEPLAEKAMYHLVFASDVKAEYPVLSLLDSSIYDAQKKREAAEYKSHIRSLEDRVSELETEVRMFMDSRSWKVTSPLRKLNGLFNKFSR